jgi:hypothetical protein
MDASLENLSRDMMNDFPLILMDDRMTAVTNQH